MNLTVKGVVLKETSYGEGDKVLTVLAEGIGKMQIWAKGARRVKSALLSASHPFTYSEFTLVEKKGSYYCNSASVLESHFKLRGDLEKLSLAGYFAELVSAVAQEGEQEDELMRLFMNALYLLTYTNKTQAHVKAVFELRLMTIAGYAPELHSCVRCGNTEHRLVAFDLSGGTVCENCASSVIFIPAAIHKALVFVTEGNEKSIFSFTLTPDVQKIFSALCENYVIRQLDTEFKTLAFYKSLFGGLNEQNR